MKTLGVVLNPVVKHEDVAKHMKDKAQKCCDNIKTRHISRDIVWMVTQMTMIESLESPYLN